MRISLNSKTTSSSDSDYNPIPKKKYFLKRLEKFENEIDEIVQVYEKKVEEEMRKLTDNLHVNMKDGSRYLGKLENNQRQGIGQNLFQNGITYRGFFKDDKMEGRGIFIKNSRAIFKGEFYQNKFKGFGKRVYENGDVYKGQFEGGVRHGTGVYKYENGDKYYGNFDNHKRIGTGRNNEGLTPRKVLFLERRNLFGRIY